MSPQPPLLIIRERPDPKLVNGTLTALVTSAALWLWYFNSDAAFSQSILQFAAFVFLAFGFYLFYRALDQRMTVELYATSDSDYRADLIQQDRLMEQLELSADHPISIESAEHSNWLPGLHGSYITLADHQHLAFQGRPLLFPDDHAQQFRQALGLTSA
jgi:hypothetical protein